MPLPQANAVHARKALRLCLARILAGRARSYGQLADLGV